MKKTTVELTRSEKVELTSTTNVVTKKRKKKSSARIRWLLGFRRERRAGKLVVILDDNQSSYTHSLSQSELPMSSYSLEYSPDENEGSACIRDHRYNKKELLKAESQVQKYVKDLTLSNRGTPQVSLLSSGSNSRSKVTKSRNAKLTSSSGVLLFDGVDEDFPDDVSFQKAIVEEHKSKSRDINFVLAPKDYDPVASGFYKPKRRENRTFYESDEEENMNMRRKSQVSAGIEIILQDGTLSISYD